MKTTHTYYELRVVGYLWSGPKSSYDYTFTGAAPTTYDHVKRIAGDFQSITSAKVVTTKTITTRTEKKIKL